MPSSSSKGLGKSIFSKLADSLGFQKEDKPTPPLPPRPSQVWKPDEEYFTSAFNDLAISNTPSHQSSSSWSGPSFIGGFNPTLFVPQGNLNVPQSPHTYSASAPNLQPLAMPMPFSNQPPQSLTMQMALRPEPSSPKISRPHSTPVSSTSKPPKSATSTSVSSGPSQTKPIAAPSTPNKRTKSDSSDSPSRSPKPGQEQCSGQTKAGIRCTRMIKIRPGSLVPNDGDEPIDRFCYQHQKEVLTGQNGFYTKWDPSVFVYFETWIQPYLQPETKASLRAEMEKVKSKSDVHGYIYAFEIRGKKLIPSVSLPRKYTRHLEPREGETIKLKVGRAVNINKRIDQWGKQCGSEQQILRGFYPPNLEDEEGNAGSLMKGRIKAGEKGPWCHRLERLIHLELADLVSYAIYLDPKWPNIDTGLVSSATEGKSTNSKNTKCPDCGTMHKEIFEFQRWKSGPNQGKEWEKLVKGVIEHWGKYVELYVQ